jgi:hypothetical protein
MVMPTMTKAFSREPEKAFNGRAGHAVPRLWIPDMAIPRDLDRRVRPLIR